MAKTGEEPAATRAEAGLRTGEAVARAVVEALGRADGAGARAIVLDRLRRTEAWVRRSFDQRKILSDAVAALGKGKALEALVRALDQADHAAFLRFVRDHPNIYVRRVRTADHLRAFLAEQGTPAAKAAFGRALRAVDAPAGAEVARYAAEALGRGEDRPAIDALERLVSRFDGGPESDELGALRKHLDDFLLGLRKAGRIEDLARALDRHTAENARRFPGSDLYGPGAQLGDLAAKFASSEAQGAWGAARGRPLSNGGVIGKEAARLLAANDADGALDLVLDELVEPLDDRFGAPPEAGARFSDAITTLAKEGRLGDLAAAAGASDAAFEKANPHAIHVAARHRLKSALDRAGSDDAKAAWRKAVEGK